MVRTVRIGMTLVSVTVAAAAVASCSSSSGGSGGGGKSFVVVELGGKTGLEAQNFASVGQGLKWAIADTNKKGGILSRQIKLVELDTQSDTSKTVSVFQKYLTENDAPQLVVSPLSTPAIAIQPLLSSKKILSISTATASILDDASKYPYLFSVTPTSVSYLNETAKKINEMGAKKVTAVLPNDALGQSETPALTHALAKYGITPQFVTFEDSDVDLSSPILKALSGKPDVIYMDGVGEAPTRLLNGRIKANGTSTPTLMGYGIGASPALSGVSAGQLKNVQVVADKFQIYKAESARSAVQQQFYKHMEAATKLPGTVPAIAEGYDILAIAKLGAEKAKSVDSTKMADALKGLPAQPVPGPFAAWTQYGYTAKSHYFLPPDGDILWVAPNGLKSGFFNVASS